MFQQIPESKNWIKIEPLLKGWSKDRKFHIVDDKGSEYLLRISDISLYEKKKQQFNLLKKIEKLNLNVSRPISFGVLDSQNIYILLSYLEGVDAKEYVKNLNNKDAYKLGFNAGIVLKKIHGIQVSNPSLSWWELYLEKVNRKITNIRNCELVVPKRELIIEYILKNLHLAKNRPLLLTHGDYHLGNMIVCNGEIGIIDFDKSAICDPYDDLKPFCWNVFESEYFETGLVNGYFNNQIPDDFFPTLALYAAESCISHLPWAIQFGEEEIKTAYQVLNETLKWYDDFNLVIPSWYKGII